MQPPSETAETLERAVLGGLLIAPELLPDLEIEAADFEHPRHGKIYRALWALRDDGHAIDVLTLRARLEREDELEAVGGVAYLASLDAELPDVANLPSYAEEIRRNRQRRGIEAIGRDLFEKAGEGDLEARIGQARRALDLLEAPAAKKEARAIDLLPGWLETVAERRKRYKETSQAAMGLRSGFSKLDTLLGGFEDKRLYLLAGPPGSGKTSLALQLALQVAGEETPAIYLSFENSAESLGLKILCNRADCGPGDALRGFIEPEKLEEAGRGLEALSLLHLHEGGSRWTVAQLRAACRRAMDAAKAPRCLVVVDYLQLWAKVGREWRDFSDVRGRVDALAGELLALARDLGSPVLALSSQNRASGGYDGSGGRASLASLKESGDLEYSADVVLFLTESDEQLNPHSKALELHVAKNRHGQTGKVALTFRGDRGTFTNRLPGLL